MYSEYVRVGCESIFNEIFIISNVFESTEFMKKKMKVGETKTGIALYLKK